MKEPVRFAGTFLQNLSAEVSGQDVPLRRRLVAAPPGTLALRALVAAAVAFGVVWVAYKAQQDPRTFVVVGLNGLTLAGLYFVVASGFTLIFGLMRVVNMAHGSLYMLAGFFAFELQERMTGGDVADLVLQAPVLECLGQGALGVVHEDRGRRRTGVAAGPCLKVGGQPDLQSS